MSYIPDRNIVKKVREYDPHLFFQWNSKKRYFELWRRGTLGRHLITPITETIYDPEQGKKVHTPLDERVLWWIHSADNQNKTNWWLEYDSRYKKFEKAKQQRIKRTFHDFSKDAYRAVANRYSTKYASKNVGRPDFDKVSQGSFARPDIQHVNRPRVFSGSANHARQVDFQR